MHMLEALTQETLADDEPGLAAAYGIRSIPTLMVLRHGEPVAAERGVVGADQLVEALDRIATIEHPRAWRAGRVNGS